jgi:hypothetical protein
MAAAAGAAEMAFHSAAVYSVIVDISVPPDGASVLSSSAVIFGLSLLSRLHASPERELCILEMRDIRTPLAFSRIKHVGG